MPCAGIDNEGTVFYRKDESISAVYSYAPFPGTIAFKRLRLADAVVAVAFNAFKKVVDSLECFLVAALPVRVFLPGQIVPNLSHATVLRRRTVVRRPFAFGIDSSSSTSMRSWS